jgi:hypothetical protein
MRRGSGSRRWQYISHSLPSCSLVPSAPQFASSYLGWGADQCFFIWCLVWWPYAFAHHLNPFVAKLVFAPSGLNLTWTTPVPLISWLALLLTSTLGPVAAYNLLCVICPALRA